MKRVKKSSEKNAKTVQENGTRRYTFVDLFAGCGGLTEGFLQSGRFESLAHVEWERPMVETLRNRLIKTWGMTKECAQRDVVLFDIQKSEELLHGNWSESTSEKYAKFNHPDFVNGGLRQVVGDKKVDIIIGGPPCQAYSIHGRAQDKNSMRDDYRNYLFESFVKVVEEFRPEMFVFENVTGILSAKPGGRHVTERIYEAFTKAGYEIRKPDVLPTAVFDAADFGVPQYRRRVIILGIRKGSKLRLDELYDSISREQRKGNPRTVRDAIAALPKIFPLDEPIKEGRANVSHRVSEQRRGLTQHEPRYHAPREVRIFKEWITKDLNHMSHDKQVEYYFNATGHKTLYTKYKNLSWDRPSHTVVAHLSKDGMMFIHPDPDQARSITIREAAILMSFPRDYQFLGSTPYCFRMIGNAVPVLLARGIADGISKELDKIR